MNIKIYLRYLAKINVTKANTNLSVQKNMAALKLKKSAAAIAGEYFFLLNFRHYIKLAMCLSFP